MIVSSDCLQVNKSDTDHFNSCVRQSERVSSRNQHEFKILFNQQNTLSFDTKNNFTITKYYDKEKVLLLKINGRDIKFGLGVEFKITNDQGKK